MPSIGEMTDLYGEFMLAPVPGPAVCEICFDLTTGRRRCHRCERNDGWLDALVPISYSVAHEQLHHALAGYKRQPQPVAARFQLELAAVLWRFLDAHERCLSAAAGAEVFDVVTSIPSSSAERDRRHPLRRILGSLVAPVRGRFEQLLVPGDPSVPPRQFSLAKYRTTCDLAGRSVLLVDDTWTTGDSARSAAAVLKQAGARVVGGVFIGRHLHREYANNDRRLQTLSRPFDWSHCALERRPLAPPTAEDPAPVSPGDRREFSVGEARVGQSLEQARDS